MNALSHPPTFPLDTGKCWPPGEILCVIANSESPVFMVMGRNASCGMLFTGRVGACWRAQAPPVSVVPCDNTQEKEAALAVCCGKEISSTWWILVLSSYVRPIKFA